jgi:hypothetical protein
MGGSLDQTDVGQFYGLTTDESALTKNDGFEQGFPKPESNLDEVSWPHLLAGGD